MFQSLDQIAKSLPPALAEHFRKTLKEDTPAAWDGFHAAACDVTVSADGGGHVERFVALDAAKKLAVSAFRLGMMRRELNSVKQHAG